jgi:Right handed beta helix region
MKFFKLLFLILIMSACSDDNNKSIRPASECPVQLSPVSLIEPVFTVGTGTPASCDFAELSVAVGNINSSETGGSIKFDCGADIHTLDLSMTMVVSKDLLIDGENKIILNGGNNSRIFTGVHYQNLVIQRITMENGYNTIEGGAVYIPWYGSLKVIDSTFLNNHATAEGPDIGGGAIYAGGMDYVIISNSYFENNSGSNGGAVNVRGCTLTLIDNIFVTNTAIGHGGGTIEGGIGGAVYIDGMNYDNPGDFVSCNNYFYGNIAGDHGGAMFCHFYDDSISTVVNNSFIANSAAGSDSGMGALYHQEAPLYLKNSTFMDNTSNLHAGALYIGQDSPTEIVNCTFYNNEVADDGVGGAVFLGNNKVQITNSTFALNRANYGPAVFSGQDGDITLKNSIFYNNSVIGDGEYNGLSCCFKMKDGGNNIQWPDKRANDTDDTPCTDSVLFVDPQINNPADNGGETFTMSLISSSPAIDNGENCPEFDQRGNARNGVCDIGSFEY